MSFIKNSVLLRFEDRGVNQQCIICDKPYQKEDSLLRLKCGHVFHEKCAISNLSQKIKNHEHRKCDLCGKKVEFLPNAAQLARELIKKYDDTDITLLSTDEFRNWQAAHAFCDLKEGEKIADEVKQFYCLWNASRIICLVGGTIVIATYFILNPPVTL